MKNILKYIAVPSLAIIVFLLIAVNYGQRLRFGDAYFENDTANKILTNKSLYFESGDSIYYNGVVVTSGTGGGGIAASDNITFTGRDSTTELWRFGDSVRFYDHVLFKDTLKVSGAIAVMDSLKVSKNLWFNNTTKLSTTLGTFYSMENAFLWQNQNAYSLLDLDSSNGMNLHYGVYTGNGSQLTNVDAITLKGQDTTHFARTDTLTTERIKSKVEFSDVITFFLSPVFSALVNFANGITVTGTATFNGDMVPAGWQKNQSSDTELQYWKEKVFKFKAPAVSGAVNVVHGVSDWHKIYDYGVIIKDDTTNMGFKPGQYYGTSSVIYCRLESLQVRIELSGTASGLANDSGFVYVRFLDPNR